ncbi:MAG: sigma-70 family RNA polymerase sigma factor [Cryomorphaceae bacterium]|nr:sigma-70 family RNA polymerase sigma factor [Cryomorphaceae bacterium]
MLLNNLDDRDLVGAYMDGNEKAFEVLLLRHKDKMYRFIYMKLKLGAYNEEGKFLPWAMRISHNLVIDHFRKSSKMRMISESSSSREDFNIFSVLSLDEKNAHESLAHDELEKQMVGLIDHLPETQRDILVKRLYQEMSFKDIAEMEDISINTALGRMRYALINLRKLIEKHQLVTEI